MRTKLRKLEDPLQEIVDAVHDWVSNLLYRSRLDESPAIYKGLILKTLHCCNLPILDEEPAKLNGQSPVRYLPSMSTPVYKRILLKISGEALAAGQGFGVDNQRVHEIAAEIGEVHRLGIEIAIVVGGGNFFRGVAEQAKLMDRVSADHMGMLATVINALALQDALEKQTFSPG